MANVFIDNSATGLNDGTTKANAYTSITTAAAAGSVNDVFIMSHIHTQNLPVSTSITFPVGSLLVSSDFSLANNIDYTRSVTKNITMNAGNLSLTLTNMTSYGVFIESTRATLFNNVKQYYCSINLGASFGVSSKFGGVFTSTYFYMCDIEKIYSGGATDIFTVDQRTKLIIEGGTVSGNNAGDIAFTVQNSGELIVRGVDLSGVDGANVCQTSGGNYASVEISDCSISANVTSVFDSSSVSDNTPASRLKSFRNSATDTRIESLENHPEGSRASDTGIYRNSGSILYGTNLSNKLTTNSVAVEYFVPLRVLIATLIVDTSTAKTFTLQLAQDGTATPLTDVEFGIDVEHQKPSGGGVQCESTKPTDNNSTTALTASSEAWAGLGGTNTKQEASLTTSLTGGDGQVKVYAWLTKPSHSVYVDLLVVQS